MLPDAQIDAIFQLSPHVRYVAVRRGDELTLREREGLADASPAESDRYEELFVNPALLTLATQRGKLGCGGLRYLLVRYGHFFAFVRATEVGHVTVALEPGADVVGLAGAIDALLGRRP